MRDTNPTIRALCTGDFADWSHTRGVGADSTAGGIMRVRPVVTVAIAALLLGACGSGARSAAPEKPTTTRKSPSTTKATSSPPVTDLNGHEVVGVKAHDVQAEAVPDKPLDRAAHALLAQQLVAARAVAMQYPTVAAATAAGYHLVGGGFGPGSGAHYIGGFSLGFEPSHPLALIYDGISPKSQMVGLMYYSMGYSPPEGFAGPNDHWHRHSGVCLGAGAAVLFPPDSNVTAVQCAKAHGSFMPVTGYMVHAWVVPGWESPRGVFSHENPDLPCADGTFHTDTIGRCQGS
jgi:hypothetical protein